LLTILYYSSFFVLKFLFVFEIPFGIPFYSWLSVLVVLWRGLEGGGIVWSRKIKVKDEV